MKINNIFNTIRIFSLFLLLSISTIICQDQFDSKGKDFWLTFIPNFHNNLTNEIPLLKYGDSLYIYITSEIPTQGKIEYYDRFGNYYLQNFSISNPNQIYTFRLSFYDYELWGYNSSGDYINRYQSEIVSKMSFHIESDYDITVYAHSQAVTTSDAFLVLPTDVLGRNYFVMSYKSDGYYLNANQITGSSTPSQFAIVATEDNTSITIKPTAPTKYNELITQNIILNRGETYLVQANIKPTLLNPDLTGTEINSDKPIALFAGHQRTKLPINPELTSRDILIEQIPPIDVWGKNAFIVPYYQVPNASPIGSDIFRVLSANDLTEVYINGTLTTVLNKGEFYESEIRSPLIITSSSPVLVAQYKKTSQDQNTVETISDPFMMLIPPKEQFLQSYRVINTQAMQYDENLGIFNKVYNEQYITIVIPNSSISTLKIDGNSINPSLFSEISNSGYSFANIKVSDGVHTAEADAGFGIYVYGYGIANSYGYIGGMGFKPLDIKPPVISYQTSCFSISGVITDTGKTDSGIKEVLTDLDSNNNVNLSIEPYQKYDKVVRFQASLNDNKKDGRFIIKAIDSLGYSSSMLIEIPGSTLSYEGFITDTIPVKFIQSSIGSDTCISIVIKNYGKFPQKILSIDVDNPEFLFNYSLPKTIAPNASDTLLICVSILQNRTYLCNISLEDECKKRVLLTIIVNPNDCDVTSFEYTDFKYFDYKNLNLIQGARRVFDFVRLSRTEKNSVGALWYKNPIPIKKGFTTKFKFRFSSGSNNEANEKSYPGADGIAFVIQNASNDVFGSSGGGIGYSGIPNSLAIEFDVFNNDSTQIINLNDPNGNHIAVMCNGINGNLSDHKANSCLITNPNILIIKSDSTVYYAKIEYNIEPNTCKVYLDTIEELTDPLITLKNLDLSQLLSLIDGDKAYLGFTSATGTAWQNHDLLSWYVCPIPQSPVDVRHNTNQQFDYISIYPNPCQNLLGIKLNGLINNKVKLTLLDILGREIFQLYDDYLPTGVYNLSFNIDKICSGFYLLKYETNDNSRFYKIIIRK